MKKNDVVKYFCIKDICVPNLKKFHQAVNEKNSVKVSYGLEEIVLRKIRSVTFDFFNTDLDYSKKEKFWLS